MIGDSIVANLNTSARMNVNPNAKTTLQSATGEEITLQEETPLKTYVPAGKRFDLELYGRHSRVVKFGHMALNTRQHSPLPKRDG